MEMFINAVPGVMGMFMIVMALVTDTQNFISSLVFKVIPFFLGIAGLFSCVKLTGIIS